MTGERTEKALNRMDLAVRRIAAGSVRAKAALDARSTALDAQSAQLETLTRRNDTLREAVAATLRELDQLINDAATATTGAPGTEPGAATEPTEAPTA